jgi:hypothetical protein
MVARITLCGTMPSLSSSAWEVTGNPTLQALVRVGYPDRWPFGTAVKFPGAVSRERRLHAFDRP